MKKLLSISIALALALSFSVVSTTPVAAGGNTLEVGDGKTYATIQAAIDDASDGDTIHVYPGTYTEAADPGKTAVLINVPNLTLQAVDEHGDVIDATEHFESPLVTIDADEAEIGVRATAEDLGSVTIEGFTVTNYSDGGVLGGRTGTTANVLRNYVLPPEVTSRQPIQVAGPSPQVIGNRVKAAYLDSEGWAAAGILVVDAENALVQGNVVYGNDLADFGIAVANYWDGAVYGGISAVVNNTIGSNIVTGCGSGIVIQAVGGQVGTTTIVGNTITGGSDFGVDVWAINHDITDVQIVGNDIANNDVGIGTYDDGGAITGTQVHWNNIYDNLGYGVEHLADEMLDATLNWWGDASGPSGEGSGTGDAVSANVDFMPWLMEEDGAETTETDTATGVDAEASTENVSAEASGGNTDTTVSVGEYVGEPTGIDPGFVVNDLFFFDVHVSGTEPDELVVEVKCPGSDCSGMVLKWFDGTSWQDVTPAAVDVNGVFQFTLDHESSPTIAELTGTPFGLGNPEPDPPPPVVVGWEGSPVNKAAVMAPWIALLAVLMAGAALLVVRRRRAEI